MSDEERLDRVRAIIAQVRSLAAEYYRLTGKSLGVTGEIAEFVAAEVLNLTLTAARTPGHDAIAVTDDSKRHIQIKGRVFAEKINPGAKLSRINKVGACDSVLLVILHQNNLELREIREASIADVKQKLAKPGKARDQGKLSFAEFRSISKRVWPRSEAA